MSTKPRERQSAWIIHSPADLGRALAGVRRETGLTQEQLAKEVSVQRSYLARIEAGVSSLVLERVLRAFRLMGATVIVTITTTDDGSRD